MISGVMHIMTVPNPLEFVRAARFLFERAAAETNRVGAAAAMHDQALFSMHRIQTAPRWALLALILAASGCTFAAPHLWPPAPTEQVYPIYVSLDTWHGMIAYSLEVLSETQPAPAAGQRLAAFEEWGYAELAWYVEERRGVAGVLRALFWPTAGTVEIGRYDRVWAFRTPQPPADLFVFHLGRESFLRLHRHLRSTIAEQEALARRNGSSFYLSSQSYHLFHHCHHYVARALQEAGLPVSPFWAVTRATLAWQLKRATRLARQYAESHPALSRKP